MSNKKLEINFAECLSSNLKVSDFKIVCVISCWSSLVIEYPTLIVVERAKYKEIPLDANGHSTLPTNTLAVRFNPLSYPSQRFVLRGLKLFDRVENKYDLRGSLGVALTGGTSDLIAEIIEELAWDDIPETGKRYITIRAGRVFANRAVTSQSIESYTADDEENALQILKRTEDMAQNHNFISGPDDLYGGRVQTTFGPDILNR